MTTKPLDAKKDNSQLNQKNSPCLIHSYLALDNKILGCWERWQLSCRAHSDPWGRSANPSPQSQHAVLRVDGTQALGHAAMGMLEANGDLLHCLCLQVGLHLPAERCTLNERSSLSPDRWVILYAMGSSCSCRIQDLCLMIFLLRHGKEMIIYYVLTWQSRQLLVLRPHPVLSHFSPSSWSNNFLYIPNNTVIMITTPGLNRYIKDWTYIGKKSKQRKKGAMPQPTRDPINTLDMHFMPFLTYTFFWWWFYSFIYIYIYFIIMLAGRAL